MRIHVLPSGSDDTVALQEALDQIGAASNGAALILSSGATYNVRELILPHAIVTGMTACAITTDGGMATLRKIPDGRYFLMAPERYLQNDNSASGHPWWLSNICFDSDGIGSYGLILANYRSKVRNCHFEGATQVDCFLVRSVQNGQPLPGYISENGLYGCHFRTLPGAAGFRTYGTAADWSDGPTDGDIVDCTFNGGAFGIDLCNTAGWMVTGNRTFSQGDSGARFRKLARGGRIANNNFDGSRIVFGDIGWYSPCLIGSNDYYVDAVFEGGADGQAECLMFSGGQFHTDEHGRFARIVNAASAPYKKIMSVGQSFQSPSPYASQNGGRIEVRGDNCAGNFVASKFVGNW